MRRNQDGPKSSCDTCTHHCNPSFHEVTIWDCGASWCYKRSTAVEWQGGCRDVIPTSVSSQKGGVEKSQLIPSQKLDSRDYNCVKAENIFSLPLKHLKAKEIFCSLGESRRSRKTDILFGFFLQVSVCFQKTPIWTEKKPTRRKILNEIGRKFDLMDVLVQVASR